MSCPNSGNKRLRPAVVSPRAITERPGNERLMHWEREGPGSAEVHRLLWAEEEQRLRLLHEGKSWLPVPSEEELQRTQDELMALFRSGQRPRATWSPSEPLQSPPPASSAASSTAASTSAGPAAKPA